MVDRYAAPQITWTNIITTLALLLTAASGGWLLFQSEFGNLERGFKQSDATINERLLDLRTQLEFVRNHTIPLSEHLEFVKRMDREIGTINDRIRIIESSRPTTGELQAVAGTTKDQLAEVKERIRSLEDNLRRVNPSPAPTHQKEN